MSPIPSTAGVDDSTRALGAPGGGPVALPGASASAGQLKQPASLRAFVRADLGKSDLTGLSIGPYALGQLLGAGGMGCVYRAVHCELERPVAVKFISAAAVAHPEAATRFRQETLALGRLAHEHIVNAVDAGVADGAPYLVTEFIEGEDLAKLVTQRGPIPVAEACEIARQAALGLAFAHRKRILHRDVKPSNLLLDHSGRVKLIDFGLARSTADDDGLTKAGDMLGTWDYVAPEQAQDSTNATAACDVYSLGCTLLFLLTGQPPFPTDTYPSATAKLKGHLVDVPPALERLRTEIPSPLHELLAAMTAKQPHDRPRDVDEVATALAPLTQSARVNGSATASARPAPAPQLRLTSNAPVLLASRKTRLAVGGIAGGVLLATAGLIRNQSGPEVVGAGAAQTALPQREAADQTSAQHASPATAEPTGASASTFVTTPTRQTASAAGIALSLPQSGASLTPRSTAVDPLLNSQSK